MLKIVQIINEVLSNLLNLALMIVMFPLYFVTIIVTSIVRKQKVLDTLEDMKQELEKTDKE